MKTKLLIISLLFGSSLIFSQEQQVPNTSNVHWQFMVCKRDLFDYIRFYNPLAFLS